MFNQPVSPTYCLNKCDIQSAAPGSSTGMQGMNNMNEPSSTTQVLYGTNINSSEVQQKLRNFLTTFVKIESDDDYTKEPFYIDRLREIHETEQYILDVDCDHVFEFDNSLYRQLENYPTDIIPIFDLVVTSVYKDLYLAQQNQNNDMGGSEALQGAGGDNNDPII